MLLRDKTERHALKGDRKPPWKGQNNKSTNVCDMNSGVSDIHCVTHLLHPQRRDPCVKSSLHKVGVFVDAHETHGPRRSFFLFLFKALHATSHLRLIFNSDKLDI